MKPLLLVFSLVFLVLGYQQATSSLSILDVDTSSLGVIHQKDFLFPQKRSTIDHNRGYFVLSNVYHQGTKQHHDFVIKSAFEQAPLVHVDGQPLDLEELAVDDVFHGYLDEDHFSVFVLQMGKNEEITGTVKWSNGATSRVYVDPETGLTLKDIKGQAPLRRTSPMDVEEREKRNILAEEMELCKTDYSTYVYGKGTPQERPVVCSEEAKKGFCGKPQALPPFCMRSCNRKCPVIKPAPITDRRVSEECKVDISTLYWDKGTYKQRLVDCQFEANKGLCNEYWMASPNCDKSCRRPCPKANTNGLSASSQMLEVEAVFETDKAFSKKFSGSSSALRYFRTVLASINAIFERDLRVRIIPQYYGHNPGGEIKLVTDYLKMDTHIRKNKDLKALADIAILIRGVAPTSSTRGWASINAVCGQKHFSAHADWNGYYLTPDDESDSPNDVLLTAHEIGHLLGSEHSFVKNSKKTAWVSGGGYDPVIDTCTNSAGKAKALKKVNGEWVPSTTDVVPPGGGIIMSYCQSVPNSDENAGPNYFKKGSWDNIAWIMGSTTRGGVDSHRVNLAIRNTVEKASCVSKPGEVTPEILKKRINQQDPEPSNGDPTPGDIPDIPDQSIPDNKTNTTSQEEEEVPEPVGFDDTKEEVLFEQDRICIANKGVPSVNFPIHGDMRAIDDFIVPKGKVWSIQQINFHSFWIGNIDSLTDVEYDIQIFSGPALACKLKQTVLGVPTNSSISLKVGEDDCYLVGGHLTETNEFIKEDTKFWISIAPTLSASSEAHFYWSFSKQTTLNFFKFQDPENFFGTGLCSTWSDGSTCGFTTAGTDLCMSIIGFQRDSQESDAKWIPDGQGEIVEDGEIGIYTEREFGFDSSSDLDEKDELKTNLPTVMQSNNNASTQEVDEIIQSEPKPEETKGEGLASWVIPVAVVGGVIGFIVLIAVAVALASRVGSDSDSSYHSFQ